MTAAEEVAGEVVTHATLAEALVAAQAEMPSVKAGGKNPGFKRAGQAFSKYVTLDDLIETTRPVLAKHGLSITQWPAYLVATDGLPIHELRTVITHASGESMQSSMALVVEARNMQNLGSAITYARRYMWSSALGIAADEDDDGNAASEGTGARRTPAKPKDDPAPTLASTEALSAFQGEVEAAGKDWPATKKKLHEMPVTEERLAVYRAKLQDLLADEAAQADAALPFA